MSLELFLSLLDADKGGVSHYSSRLSEYGLSPTAFLVISSYAPVRVRCRPQGSVIRYTGGHIREGTPNM